MIKLNNQQIKALAAKIIQNGKTKIVSKQEQEKEQFLEKNTKAVTEYLDACDSLTKARKNLIST